MNNHINEDKWFEQGEKGNFDQDNFNQGDFSRVTTPSNAEKQPSILNKIYKNKFFRAAAVFLAASGAISYRSSLEVKQERDTNSSVLASTEQVRANDNSVLASIEQERADDNSVLACIEQEIAYDNSVLESIEQVSQNSSNSVMCLLGDPLNYSIDEQTAAPEVSIFTKQLDDSIEQQTAVIIRGADLSTVRSFAGTEDSLLSDSNDLTSLRPISNGQNAVVVTERDGLLRRLGPNAAATRGDVFEQNTVVTLTGRTQYVEFKEGANFVPATLVEVTHEGRSVYVIAGHLNFNTNQASPSLNGVEEESENESVPQVEEGSENESVPQIEEGSENESVPQIEEKNKPDLVREVIDAGSPVFLAFEQAKTRASTINNSDYSDLLSDIVENADRGANAYGQSVYYANLLNDLFEGNLPVGSVINIGSAPYIVQRGNKQGLGRAIRQQMGYCETDIRRAWNEILDLASTYESSSGESLGIDASLREYEMPNVRAILRDIRNTNKSTDTGNETVDALMEFPNELIGLNVSYKSKRGTENTYIFKGVDENGNLELAPINSPNFIIRLKPATAALGNLGLIDNAKSIDRGIDDFDQDLVELCQDTTAENVEQALSS